MYLWSFTVTTVTGSHKSFACALYEVTLDVTGDGRGDGNSRTVSRFVPALFSATSYPSFCPKTPHRAAWRRCEHKCGVYLQFRRTTEQSVSNAVDMLFAPFVDCSFYRHCSPNNFVQRNFTSGTSCLFLFGVVRCVFVLKSRLKVRSCAENRTCSFCSAKK